MKEKYPDGFIQIKRGKRSESERKNSVENLNKNVKIILKVFSDI